MLFIFLSYPWERAFQTPEWPFQISMYDPDMLVWIDEMGSARRNSIRQYGYSLRGMPARVHQLTVGGRWLSAIPVLTTSGIEYFGSPMVMLWSTCLRNFSLSQYPLYLAPTFKEHCTSFHSPGCESFFPIKLLGQAEIAVVFIHKITNHDSSSLGFGFDWLFALFVGEWRAK